MMNKDGDSITVSIRFSFSNNTNYCHMQTFFIIYQKIMNFVLRHSFSACDM
jgi:hypothetical protein